MSTIIQELKEINTMSGFHLGDSVIIWWFFKGDRNALARNNLRNLPAKQVHSAISVLITGFSESRLESSSVSIFWLSPDEGAMPDTQELMAIMREAQTCHNGSNLKPVTL